MPTVTYVNYLAGVARVQRDIPLRPSSYVDTGGETLTFSGLTLTRSAGDWAADGFLNDDAIQIRNTASNNRAFIVDTVTALVMTLIPAVTTLDDFDAETIAGAGVDIIRYVDGDGTFGQEINIADSPLVAKATGIKVFHCTQGVGYVLPEGFYRELEYVWPLYPSRNTMNIDPAADTRDTIITNCRVAGSVGTIANGGPSINGAQIDQGSTISSAVLRNVQLGGGTYFCNGNVALEGCCLYNQTVPSSPAVFDYSTSVSAGAPRAMKFQGNMKIVNLTTGGVGTIELDDGSLELDGTSTNGTIFVLGRGELIGKDLAVAAGLVVDDSGLKPPIGTSTDALYVSANAAATGDSPSKGTPNNPLNIADLPAAVLRTGKRRVLLVSDNSSSFPVITVPAGDYRGLIFEDAFAPKFAIRLNPSVGTQFDFSQFKNIALGAGTYGSNATAVIVDQCQIREDVSLGAGTIVRDSEVFGTSVITTLGNLEMFRTKKFIGASQDPIQISGVLGQFQGLALIDNQADITLRNLDFVGVVYRATLTDGFQINLEATCTEGELVVRGAGSVGVNDSAGNFVVNDDLLEVTPKNFITATATRDVNGFATGGTRKTYSSAADQAADQNPIKTETIASTPDGAFPVQWADWSTTKE